MRKATLFPLSCSLLLAACTLPTPSRQQQNSPASSSSASSEEVQLQGEEIGEGMPLTEELTETGALAERFLSTGVLEIGNPQAPLTLLMFTEHHCSYCRQVLLELFPRLKTDALDLGSVKVQIAMHDTLFRNPNKSKEAILSYAVDLKLDTALLRDCMKSARTTAMLEDQQVWAQSLGIDVVPTFFLNGEKFIGLPYYPDLRGRIEEALQALKEQQ